jgi:hypothetical protein
MIAGLSGDLGQGSSALCLGDAFVYNLPPCMTIYGTFSLFLLQSCQLLRRAGHEY